VHSGEKVVTDGKALQSIGGKERKSAPRANGTQHAAMEYGQEQGPLFKGPRASCK